MRTFDAVCQLFDLYSFPPSLFGRLRKMSRAARWLRNLWSGSKERKTCGGGEGFEKKRWSFKKCSRENLGIAAWHNSDVDCMEEQSRLAVAVAVATAAAANAAVAAARVAAEAVRFGPHRRGGLARPAAVRIQAAFRGYLARRALGALRGMVKLQALVRGDLARKQAAIRALERRTDYSRQLPARISIPHRRQLRDGENCRSPAPAGKSTPKSRVVDSQSPKYMASTQSSAAKRWAQPRRRPLGEINAEVKADVGGGSVEALEFRRAVVGKLERTQSEHLQRK